MKKGATPQLDHKWWSKNKPKLVMKSTGFGNALKAYQVADERLTAKDMSSDDIMKACANALKSLSEVKKKPVVAIDSFDKKMHADEIAVMKKYPKIILGEENRIKDMAKQAKDSVSAPAAAPKQKIGKNLTYFEVDISKKVLAEFSPQWMDKFSGYSLNLTLNSDISQALTDADDAQTLQFMVVDAQKLAEACVTQMVALLRKADGEMKGKTPEQIDKIGKEAKAKVEKTFATAAKGMQMVPEARWKKFIAANKQYKDYKVKVAKTFTLGTLGIAGSIAGLAATPFTGGASGALAIVGLVRSCAALAR
ncbi:MAG: hypothetical protein MK098_02735, partial [Marinovum sp.]|nr:hypothetical protein [Marinovum sp.]